MTPPPIRQRGAALLLLTLGLLCAVAVYTLPSIHLAQRELGYRILSQASLLTEAKAALLARAATDANRPGSLPCPDWMTDSQGLSNVPGDGKADNLVGSECPSYLGWLPWVTLDLPDARLADGSRLWYALAPAYRDDDNAPPLNGETADSLLLDQRNDIVALIIAPGAPLSAQSRTNAGSPSRNIADYLESTNTNNNGRTYVSQTAGKPFNDSLLPITRQELMAVTGKRIAGEIRQCLNAHRSATSNRTQRYPWPAPLTDTQGHGQAGSHFGRIPETQAGPGPQATLRTLAGLVAWPTTPDSYEAQKKALDALRATTGSLQRLLIQLFEAGKQANQLTTNLLKSFGKLDSNILDAEGNGNISTAEQAAIREQGTASLAPLSALEAWLNANGFDYFPNETMRLARTLEANLGQSPNQDSLPQLQALTGFLQGTSTRNADLSARLAEALTSGSMAENALREALQKPDEPKLAQQAQARIQETLNQLKQLLSAIEQNRLDTPAIDILHATEALSQTLSQADASADTRREALQEILTLVSGISTGSSPVLAARTKSLAALNQALASPGERSPQSRSALLDCLQALISAMTGNDDNLTLSSFTSTASAYRQTQARLTATPNASLADIEALRLQALSIANWSTVIQRHGKQMATFAGGDPTTGSGSEQSASQAALVLSNALDNSLGTLDKLLSNPGSSTLKANADQAQVNGREALSRLLVKLGELGSAFASGTAASFPMLWHADRCGILQDSKAWWNRNQWRSQVFYQIAGLGENASKLAVNSLDRGPLVVIAAGPPNARQIRPSLLVGDYLEAENADATRNGTAPHPAANFRRLPVSPNFNDQLAY